MFPSRFTGSRAIERIDSGALTATAIAAAPFTVPTGQLWIVHGFVIRLATSATAGNRNTVWELRDTADVVLYANQSIINQVASTTYNHVWIIGTSRDAAIIGNTQGFITAAYPFAGPFALRAGEDLRVRDVSGIDGAGDSYRVQIHLERLFS